jgi:hypothetical protein
MSEPRAQPTHPRRHHIRCRGDSQRRCARRAKGKVTSTVCRLGPANPRLSGRQSPQPISCNESGTGRKLFWRKKLDITTLFTGACPTQSKGERIAIVWGNIFFDAGANAILDSRITNCLTLERSVWGGPTDEARWLTRRPMGICRVAKAMAEDGACSLKLFCTGSEPVFRGAGEERGFELIFQPSHLLRGLHWMRNAT